MDGEKELDEALCGIEIIEPSEGFHGRVMSNIMSNINEKPKAGLGAWALSAACALFIVLGCFAAFGLAPISPASALSQSADRCPRAANAEAYAAGDYKESAADIAAVNGIDAIGGADGSKVISSVTISIKADDVEAVWRQAKTVGAVLYDNYSGYGDDIFKQGEATLAVSAAGYEAAIANLRRLGDVMSFNENRQNVTGVMAELETSLSVKKGEMARLMTLMEHVENVEDMLKLEYRMSDVTYEIEGLTGQLRSYNDSVSTPTIYVNIYNEPVFIYEEPPLNERARTAFAGSIERLGEVVVGAAYIIVPFIIIAVGAVVVRVVVLIIRRRQK